MKKENVLKDNTMPQKNVMFDLDDTLLDFKTGSMYALSDEYGKNIHWDGWDTYNLLEIYGLTPKQLCSAWKKHEVIQRAEPLVHAYSVLKMCELLGYNIVIVSARGWHPEGKKITEDWLKKYSMPYNDLIITKPGECKVDSLKQYDEFEFAVDDHFDNCKDFSDSGKFKKTFMVHAPWNKAHNLRGHNINRLYCLNDLRKILEKGI